MKAVQTGALLATSVTGCSLNQHSDSQQTSPFRHVELRLAIVRLVSFGRDIFVERGGSHRQQFAWAELAEERDEKSCCFFTLQRTHPRPSARGLEYVRQAYHRPAIEVQVWYSRKRQVLGKVSGRYHIIP